MRALPIACAGLFALMATPAAAQTYPPDVPVCMQVYVWGGGYIDCSYATMAQCQQSASGRGAQCVINPFFVGNAPRAPRRDRRDRRRD